MISEIILQKIIFLLGWFSGCFAVWVGISKRECSVLFAGIIVLTCFIIEYFIG